MQVLPEGEEIDPDSSKLYESLTDPQDVPRSGFFFEVLNNYIHQPTISPCDWHSMITVKKTPTGYHLGGGLASVLLYEGRGGNLIVDAMMIEILQEREEVV